MPYLTYARLAHDLEAAGVTTRLGAGDTLLVKGKLTDEMRQGLRDFKHIFVHILREDERARKRVVKA